MSTMEHRNVVVLRLHMVELETEAGTVGAVGVATEVHTFPQDAPTLDYLQRTAGARDEGGSGFVDVVVQDLQLTNKLLPLKGHAPFDADHLDIWVDDEGKINGTPLNPLASILFNRELHGTVVICTSDDEGNTVGLTEHDVAMVNEGIENVTAMVERAMGAAGMTREQALQDAPPEVAELADEVANRVLEKLGEKHADAVLGSDEGRVAVQRIIEGAEALANGEEPF